MSTASPSAAANTALAFVPLAAAADDKENAPSPSPSSPAMKKKGLSFVSAVPSPIQKPATPKNRIGLAFISGSPIPVQKPATPVVQ
eukprot:gene8758-24760_t